MKHFRAPTILVGGLAVVALLAGNAVANTAVFSGRYAGTATEKVDGQDVTAAASGKGTATVIGKGTISGTVVPATAGEPALLPVHGPGTIAGPRRQAEGHRRAHLARLRRRRGRPGQHHGLRQRKVTGRHAQVPKGKGSLHFSGHYDRRAAPST